MSTRCQLEQCTKCSQHLKFLVQFSMLLFLTVKEIGDNIEKKNVV